MAIGPGEAILSTISAQSAAWQQAESEKHANTVAKNRRMEDIIKTLGQYPTLLKKGQEEQEIRGVQQAATAGFLERGWDGMLEAGLAAPSTSAGAEAEKFKLTLDVTQAKDRASLLALRSEELSLNARDRAQQLKEQQFTFDRNKAAQEAMAPIATPGPTLPGQGLSLPMGGAVRAPTGREALGRLARSPQGTPQDLQQMALLEQQQEEMNYKARTAMDKEAGLAERAAEKEKTDREKNALTYKVALMNAGSKRLGVMMTGQGQANDLAVAMMRDANDKQIAQERNKTLLQVEELRGAISEDRETMEAAQGAAEALGVNLGKLLGHNQKEQELIGKGLIDFDGDDEAKQSRLSYLSSENDFLIKQANALQKELDKAAKRQPGARSQLGILDEGNGKSALPPVKPGQSWDSYAK